MVIRRNEQNIPKKRIIDSSNLVPGDLIEITNNLLIPADIVLIYGNCIIRDNFKSEENSSTTKIAIEKDLKIHLKEIDQKNLLFTGNQVLYTLNHINEGCFGMVLNTGFYTKKGETIRSMLVGPKSNYIYRKDLFAYYIIMSSLAIFFSISYLVYEKFYRSQHRILWSETAFKICQVFIVLLKPAVPIVIFATTDWSTKKLHKKKVEV